MGKKSFSQLLGKNDEATLLTVRMKAPSRKSLRCLWNFILMRTIDYPLRDDSAEVLKAIETFYDRMEYEYSGDSFKNALKFLQLGAFSVPKTIIHHRKLSYLKTPQYHPLFYGIFGLLIGGVVSALFLILTTRSWRL